jgi:D-glycero-alpha-D-manno-heptose-7-phosphate kinase
MDNRKHIINAVAPIRVCDLGGWTDTWFSDAGAVCNIGVYPFAEVQVYVRPSKPGRNRITINAENYGDRYDLDPAHIVYDKHPLLEASIDILELKDFSFEVCIYSEVPSGASTGTSAAVTVAFLGALDLLNKRRHTVQEIAVLAHSVETTKLGLQCGIQDQICSAYGGICFIEMSRYPEATVTQISIPDSLWWELERRLVLVYLGRGHSSSDVHRQVIKGLEKPDADKSVLARLRKAACAGRDALCGNDLRAFGEAMISNTEAQGELHPALISSDSAAVIELAKKHGAIGWKVNGAGGEGGSLTLLCGAEGEKKRAFINAVHEMQRGIKVIPTYLSRRGLRRWEEVE